MKVTAAATKRRCNLLWWAAIAIQVPLWWFLLSSVINDRSDAAADCPGRIPADVRIAPFHGHVLPAQWKEQDARYHVNGLPNATILPVRRSFIVTSYTSAVPEPLHANLQQLLDANPDFVLEYFTLPAARTYMQRESSQRFADAFYRMSNINDKLTYFALVYVRARGGFVIDTRLTSFQPTPSLDGSSRYVLLIDDVTRSIEPRFFAGAAGDEGFIAALVEEATKRALSRKRHASSVVITPDLFEEVFRAFEGFPVKSRIRTRTGCVWAVSRRPTCYAAAIVDAESRRVGHFGCDMQCQAGYSAWVENSNFVVTEPVEKQRCNVRSDLTLETVAISTVPRASDAGQAAAASSAIPRVMYHLVPRTRVPRATSRAISTQVDHHPDLEHRVMDLHFMREYAHRFPDSRVKTAFEQLAFTSDRMQLFMLAYLSEYGGIVLPTTALLEGPLPALYAAPAELVLATERKPTDANDTTVLPARWVIAAAPRNPVIVTALGFALKRILSRRYPHDGDSVVGPGVIMHAYHQIYKNSAAVGPAVRWLKLLPAGVCNSPRLESADMTFTHLAYQSAQSDAWFFDNNEAAHAAIYLEADVVTAGDNAACPFGVRRLSGAITSDIARAAALRPVEATPFRYQLDEASPQTGIRMPRVIFQVERRLVVPPGMRRAMQSVMDHNPDFRYLHFDEVQMTTFVKTRCDSKAARAYASAVPFEIRADLFKYCYLLVEGGVYVGPTLTAVASLTTIVTGDLDFVAAEDNNERTVFTGFIASVAGHPVLRRALSIAADRVLARHYVGANSIAGSAVLGEAFSAIIGHFPKGDLHIGGVRLVQHVRNEDCAVGQLRFPGKAATFYTGYRDEALEAAWYTLGEVSLAQAVENKTAYREAVDGANGCPMSIDSDAMIHGHDDDAPRSLFDVPSRQEPTRRSAKTLKIPRHVLQTNRFDKVPKGLREAMSTVYEVNGDFVHHFYSDERIKSFMRNNFDRRVVLAFDSLVPGAFRSDLFRYCWLYLHGGVYIDGDISAVAPLEDLLSDPSVEFLTAEDNGTGWLYNALMATVPGHPLLGLAINMSVTRILANDYGPHTLSVTGPLLLSEAFAAFTGDRPSPRKTYRGGKVAIIEYSRKPHCGAGYIKDLAGRIFFYTSYPGYRREMNWYHDQEPYFNLWTSRRVFRDPAVECPTSAISVAALEPAGRQGIVQDVAAHRPAKSTPPTSAPLIPHHIIQFGTSDRVPSQIRDAMATIELWNPEYHIEYYNSLRATDFAHRNCNLTRASVPPTLLRRLFVYCYLLLHGGVYIDARFVAVAALDEVLLNGTTSNSTPTVFTAVAHQSTKSILTATDSFIAAPPGHVVLANALKTLQEIIGGGGELGETGDEAYAAAVAASRTEATFLKRANVDGCDMAHVLTPMGKALFWSPKPPGTTTPAPAKLSTDSSQGDAAASLRATTLPPPPLSPQR